LAWGDVHDDRAPLGEALRSRGHSGEATDRCRLNVDTEVVRRVPLDTGGGDKAQADPDIPWLETADGAGRDVPARVEACWAAVEHRSPVQLQFRALVLGEQGAGVDSVKADVAWPLR